MALRSIKNNLLFWKITAVFTSLLAMLGITYFLIASWMSSRNFNAINQQLYGDVASNLTKMTRPIRNGRPDTAVTHDIIHSIMVINPSVEVYLLDTTGKIIDFVVPDRSVKTSRVNLNPIWEYMRDGPEHYVTGDNPKMPDQKTIFSAAPMYDQGRLQGYVYAVLASEKQAQIANALNRHFLHGLGTVLFIATLLVVFLVGSITFFLITDSICKISAVVKRFKDGDNKARIQGYARGNLGVLTSTFNEMADTIVSNMNKLTEIDRLRQELIANVSHDLRSPLAITQGYVETLIIKRDSLNEQETKRYLSIVMSSLKRLSHLVEQLFEYSKLEANQIRPVKEPFLLTELVSDILMKYDILAKKKGIAFSTDVQENLPAVFADIALVERAIQNLIDNALKFTPQGGTITISVQDRGQALEIAIADTGIGIPLGDQSYIFDRYKKFPSHEIKNADGAGLGLSIVKKIIELHQTTINVRSTPGAGTTFWFNLPTAFLVDY
ncbi:MAG TPA: HAMP domain-containing sensor histidine kinase [Puia sp.]|uniref:HAMP domain-containing sensor histidine kinase n=1 Tax=Puia sp. TaxID=2045100 RepID=UPI002D0BADEF|nr:HAMP domain-containing sensor histidine kinase [Puia sp.]HVU96063.1 HAMP domain-containing sensor histidine kinase [Puia sp.]